MAAQFSSVKRAFNLPVGSEIVLRGWVRSRRDSKGVTFIELNDGSRFKSMQLVVEVTYNEIQRSPQYSSGFALRFARITRIRDDKGPGQITTLAELQALYEWQFRTKHRPSI